MSKTLEQIPEWQALQAAKEIEDEAGRAVLMCLAVGIKSGSHWLKRRNEYLAAAKRVSAAYKAWAATPDCKEISARIEAWRAERKRSTPENRVAG